MTTKPRHTTNKTRHGADGRRAQQQALAKQLDRELAEQLRALDGIPTVGIGITNAAGKPLRPRLVAIFTVRKDGGLPYRWEFVTPSGTWRSEVEHLARLAAKKAGLTVHAHIDTEDRML